MRTDDAPGGWRAALRPVREWNALPGRVRRQLLTGRRFPHDRAEAEAALAYARRTSTFSGALTFAVTWLVVGTFLGRRRARRLAERAAWALEDDDLRTG